MVFSSLVTCCCSSSSSPSTSTSIIHVLPGNYDPPYRLLQHHHSLNLLSQCNNIQTLKQIHSHFIKTGLHNTLFAQTKLIEFCALSPSGDLSYALSIFQSIPQQQQQQLNHFIWNIIIRCHSFSHSPISSVQAYSTMLESRVQPNSYTFPFLLKSCAKAKATHEGKQVHAHVLKLGLHSDAHVHTSLIAMYARVGELDDARLVFDKSTLRDAVSFTALITGYVSMGYVDDARRLFDEIPTKDVVSWNAMVSGYVQSSRFEEALACFKEMQKANVSPNQSTTVTVLSACGHSGALELGNWIAPWVRDNGLGSNLQVTNALIDMYSKCGEVVKARGLFDGIKERDVISWNTMIGGYSHMSFYEEALAQWHSLG